MKGIGAVIYGTVILSIVFLASLGAFLILLWLIKMLFDWFM